MEPRTGIIQVCQTGNEARERSQTHVIGAAPFMRLSSE
jgi:hypothetical protein